GKGAVHIAPKLRRAVLWQRTHDGRPKQPEFAFEKVRREELLDAPPVQMRLGGQRKSPEVQRVAKVQAIMGAVQDAAVAVDDMHLVIEKVPRIEIEEFFFDRLSGITGGGDVLQQVEGA